VLKSGFGMSKTTCPIYRPTLNEFQNFSKYIQHIEKSVDLEQVGLVKIIPPEGIQNVSLHFNLLLFSFLLHLPPYLPISSSLYFSPLIGWYPKHCNLNDLQNFLIISPVSQLVSRVGSGSYTVNLLEKNDMTFESFYNFAQKNSLQKKDLLYDDIERNFWRSIGVNGGLADPMYGADMVGSLFGTDHASSWNVNHLDTPLKIIGKNLPGVSNAMLYFGCWRAMFAFHTEDMELYSINYLHYGAPKSWYSVPPKYKQRFEILAQSLYSEEYYSCSQFLRHKTSLISPSRLKDCAIPYHTAVQEIGEFMITFPGSYHQGYNHGFNIAEATNFATERWIDVARNAKICHCQPDSVNIDMDIFETLYYRDQMKKKILNRKLLQQSKSSPPLVFGKGGKEQCPCEGEEKEEKLEIIESTYEMNRSSSSTSTSVIVEAIDLTDSADDQQQSDNSMNTNNNEETQWLLRCKCGKRVWYPLIPTPTDSNPDLQVEIHDLNFAHLVVAEGDIFQCIDCGLWCHIECIYGSDFNETNLTDDARCHMCSTFDISPIETTTTSREDGGPLLPLLPTNTSTQREYQISVTTPSLIASQDGEEGENQVGASTQSLQEGEKQIHEKKSTGRPKKFHPKLRDNITAAVYSKALLRYENVTGEIVAIEGTNIRIHIKVALPTHLTCGPYIFLFISL
jgi:[histone H3]-trimethyl-L-lysine9/36 demethylase